MDRLEKGQHKRQELKGRRKRNRLWMGHPAANGPNVHDPRPLNPVPLAACGKVILECRLTGRVFWGVNLDLRLKLANLEKINMRRAAAVGGNHRATAAARKDLGTAAARNGDVED